MRAAIFLIVLLSSCAAPALSGDTGQLETGPGGSMLCEDPKNLVEALHALHDDVWMGSIRCFSAPAGVPLVRIQDADATTWRVRYMPSNAEHRTLFGYYFQFHVRGKGIPEPRWLRADD